jgi:uncharacterized protein YutE (UPF0331/DUF86 family)
MYLLCWRKQAGYRIRWLWYCANMVGFRNIAVHDYQALQLAVTVTVIEKHLDDFLLFSKKLLMRDETS